MASSEERLKILEMIRDGKLSADEGTRLLQALQSGTKKATSDRDPRWLRVRVTDLKSGQTKLNVNIPMSLVSVGIKMGARFAPSNIPLNYDEIMQAIRDGTTGKIVDLEDQTEGERVEIWSE